MSCEKCPCPYICLQRPSFCEWALTGEKSKLDHICMRSALGENPDIAPPVQSERTVISTGNGGMVTIPLSESLQLNKEMKECPHYERNSTCGCGKALCKAGKGEPDNRNNNGYGLVSIWDCGHCLRPEVELYAIHAYKKILP